MQIPRIERILVKDRWDKMFYASLKDWPIIPQYCRIVIFVEDGGKWRFIKETITKVWSIVRGRKRHYYAKCRFPWYYHNKRLKFVVTPLLSPTYTL